MTVARRLFVIVASIIMVAACHTTPTDRDSVTVGTLTISGAYLVAPVEESPAAMYFTVRNSGATADTLINIRVAGVEHAELHTEIVSSMPHTMAQPTPHAMPTTTMTTMVPMQQVLVPANAVLRLVPGGQHVMLMGVRRHFTRGDSTQADVTFKNTGTVHVPVRVIDYAQLDTLVRTHGTE